MKSPLVAHIILNLDVGGLETGLVNLINYMPDRYRHAIICLGYATEFRNRINREDVEVHELHKRDGKDPALYFRLWKLLRRLRPDIAHTRDFAALDSMAIVALAGVGCRVHSLHGWRMKNTRKYHILHHGLKRLIHYNVTVSRDLATFLVDEIGVAKDRVQPICNGVDTETFHPAKHKNGLQSEAGAEFGADKFIIGTAGRLVTVKDQHTLVKAFAQIVREQPMLGERLRLVIIGDGPLRDKLRRTAVEEGIADKTWLAGNRNDVQALLREMDLFVLSSISEGISNTILEAMASGLPVVATNVGGSPEIVNDGQTGRLVPISDPLALAAAMKEYAEAPQMAVAAGYAGRMRTETEFSIAAMADVYAQVYDAVLQANARSRHRITI